MNCKQCEQPLPEGTAFCANCGAKQEQITSANEQVIIKSKKGSLLTFNLVMLGVGGVAFIIVWICLRAANSHYTDTSELFAESLPYMLSWISIPLIIILAVANLILAGMKCDITVTDKRVYGKSNFGKQVDLPFDAISAVAVFNLFKGVSVATSSGQIKFILIANAEEIHKAISERLIKRQDKPTVITSAPIPAPVMQVKATNAEEIKQYKELLDSGIITQEEFEAKKKQLLGL